jgi:hypothetical protein
MNDLQNDYQLNSLLTVLRIFEHNLHQADEWWQGKEESGILYQQKLALSDKQQDFARRRIARTLEHINDLAQTLDLPSEKQDPAGLIRGQLTVSWADLMDTRSKTLRRFGEVDPRLPEVLDPSINYLAQAAIDLARIFDDHVMIGKEQTILHER